MKYSVLELPLVTEKWQEDVLNKKMECSRRIYNSMLSMELKKYGEMVKTKEWRSLNDIIREELKVSPSKKTEKLKEAYNRKNQILRENEFTDFDFRSQAIIYSKYYQKHISSTMASMGIGVPMWAAFEKLFFGDGEKVSFKPYDTPVTLVSDNHSGIRFLQEDDGRYYIFISNRNAKTRPVKIYIKGPNTTYDKEMLDATVKIVRILKKVEKGKDKFYCQLTVNKAPFVKMDENGNPKHPIGNGVVGLSIWRGKLCPVSANKTICVDLAPDIEAFATKRDAFTKELEHLRRVNNPNNYNDDGTVKKGIVGEDGKRHRLYWNNSNHYKNVKAELRELYRKHNVEKDLLQNKIISELLSMGDKFYFADTSFLTKKPEWNEEEPLSNTEYKIKKNRRKSIQENAPSMFLTKLDMKLDNRNLPPVTRYKLPEELFWYSHDSGVSNKMRFPEENIIVNGAVVNQTMYRAFLIRHFDGKVYHQDTLADEWNNFISLTKNPL